MPHDPFRRARERATRAATDAAHNGHTREPTGYETILAHFRQEYLPVFRRGDLIYSSTLGRTVSASEACFAPGIGLVEKLSLASDCPRSDDGLPRQAQIPRFFRTWAPSAFKDLRAFLPDEEASPEAVATAGEYFRSRVAAGLTTQVTLGYQVRDQEETRVERRSLIAWAQHYARIGAWMPVRTYLAWSRWDRPAPNQTVLALAVRVELFSQLNLRDLGDMGQRKFALLCETYGVGTAQRACGRRVVELSREFIDGILMRPTMPEGQPETSGVDDDERN